MFNINETIQICFAAWIFGPVVILLPKKPSPLYEDVGSIPKIFKIYVCEFRLEFLSYIYIYKKNETKMWLEFRQNEKFGYFLKLKGFYFEI